MEGARCAALADAPPGGLIVPVDDHDWFAPDLAQRLRAACRSSLDGYHWKRRVLEPLRPRRGLLRFVRPWRRSRERFTCATNNYALVNEPSLAPLVGNHLRASDHFDAHPERVRRIQGTLSVQNRSLASQTTLGSESPTISRDELVAAFHRYRDLYVTWPVPRGVAWARPYIEEMAELMADLRLR